MTGCKFTQEVVRELLDYDPETGFLTWRIRDRRWFKSDRTWRGWNKRYPGTQTGSPDGDGYLRCIIFDRFYPSHRIIWLWMTGDYPSGQIDHQNHNRQDNRWHNLRDVTSAENNKNRSLPSNNTSGVIGVYWHSRQQKWCACIKIGGRKRHIGLFANKVDAIAARKAAEAKFGFHPLHGTSGGNQQVLLWQQAVAASEAA